MADASPATAILIDERDGPGIAAKLLPIVYDELRNIARRRLDGERSGHTLQATALVHEAYCKLVDQDRVDWRGRSHFLAVASEAMRRILIDHARARGAEKRGAGRRVEMPDDPAAEPSVDVDDATVLAQLLALFEVEYPRPAQVASMRFLAGMTVPETATALGVSDRSVELDWRFARAWLRERLSQE